MNRDLYLKYLAQWALDQEATRQQISKDFLPLAQAHRRQVAIDSLVGRYGSVVKLRRRVKELEERLSKIRDAINEHL